MNVSSPALPKMSDATVFNFDFHKKHGWLPNLLNGTPREGTITIDRAADGTVDLKRMTLTPRVDMGGPFRYWVWNSDEPTTPKFQGAIDAFEAALPGVLKRLDDDGRSHRPDHTFGSARDSFAFYTGRREQLDTPHYNGFLTKPEQDMAIPAAQESAALLLGLFDTLQSETGANWTNLIPYT